MRAPKTPRGRCGRFLDSTKAAEFAVFGFDDVMALEAFVLAEIARASQHQGAKTIKVTT